MRNLLKWAIAAALGLALLFGLVLAPVASAWSPGYTYPNYPTYSPVYPNRGYTYYVGCTGCPTYGTPGYSYVYPYRTYPYNYNYVYPYNYNYSYNYNYVNPYNYSYTQPPAVYNGGWGSFGTYQNWANAFYAQHGRWPNQQDINDYWWSQGFAATYGFSPYAPAPSPWPY
jgi:hypothetical protein